MIYRSTTASTDMILVLFGWPVYPQMACRHPKSMSMVGQREEIAVQLAMLTFHEMT
jgi:hypothetical protein